MNNAYGLVRMEQERNAAMSLDYKAAGRCLSQLRQQMGYEYVTPFAKYLGVGLKRLWHAENGGPLAKGLAPPSGKVPWRDA